MADGIVVHDNENVGTFSTLPNNKIEISFDSDRYANSMLELAKESGSSLTLLSLPDDIEE